MYFKKLISFIITCVLVFSFSGRAAAELFSVSVAIPVYQNFQDGDIKADGMPVGLLAHFKFPIMVGIGVESYQTKIDGPTDVAVQTNMLDVFYLLPVPIINITIGLGVGNVAPDIDKFKNGLAYQYWGEIGFPFFPFLNAHISYHKIFASLESDSSSVRDADIDSEMIALGVGFIF